MTRASTLLKNIPQLGAGVLCLDALRQVMPERLLFSGVADVRKCCPAFTVH
jgi:hypothetical protein